jgi:hypothetical protein
MKLFDIDEATQLPIPTAEARTIVSFNEVIKRLQKVPGDSDGRKKTRNLQELAYVYFTCRYDSRFKLMSKEEMDVAIKSLVGLPTDWTPDELVNDAMKTFTDMQWTENIDLVHELQRSIKALTAFSKRANDTLPNVGLDGSRDVNLYLDVLDRIPATLDKLKKAKDLLHTEQENIAKGLKGRTINKYELKDKR